MNLVIVTDFYPPDLQGGPETTAALVVSELRARGHTVSVLTSRSGRPRSDGGVHRVIPRYHHPNVPATKLSPARKTWVDGATYLLARAHVRAVRPDVVLVQTGRYTSFRAATAVLSLGVPSVFFAHDTWLAGLRRACAGAGRLGRLRARLVYRGFGFRRVALPSRDLLLRYLDAGFPESQLAVLHHGVDTALFAPRPAAEPRGRPEILFVGGLYDTKRVDVAIRALELLGDRGHPEAVLTIAGVGHPDYTRHLREEVARLSLEAQVRFAGRVEHESLPEVFARASVVVLPSRYETFSITAVEAMGCGRPVVASAVGGLREIIRDGVDGVLVPSGDAGALADAIGGILDHPERAAALGAAARETVVRRFSKERFAAELEALLRDARGAATD